MRSTPGLFLAVFALGVVGCEQAVDLEGLAPAQIVIESRLSAGATVTVDVKVIDSFGRPTDSEGLEDTKGLIRGSDGREGILEVSRFTDSTAVLTVDSFAVREGGTYTLELQAPGFAMLRSITTVPKVVDLKVFNQSLPVPGAPVGASVEVPIDFADPIDEYNFFHLIVRVREATSEGGANLILSPSHASLVSGGLAVASGSGSWLFSDQGFRNERFSATLHIDRGDLAQFEKPVAVVELRSVSQAYYTYFVGRDSRQFAPNAPGSESLADNVVNGAGLFGSYSSSLLQINLN